MMFAFGRMFCAFVDLSRVRANMSEAVLLKPGESQPVRRSLH